MIILKIPKSLVNIDLIVKINNNDLKRGFLEFSE